MRQVVTYGDYQLETNGLVDSCQVRYIPTNKIVLSGMTWEWSKQWALDQGRVG